ncbi:MAG: hypothetical protein ACKOC6_05435, partial [bacterium]
YESEGGQMGANRPINTDKHATNGRKHVITGFQMWYRRREQQIAIADWVLQRLWGLPRSNVPR